MAHKFVFNQKGVKTKSGGVVVVVVMVAIKNPLHVPMVVYIARIGRRKKGRQIEE